MVEYMLLGTPRGGLAHPAQSNAHRGHGWGPLRMQFVEQEMGFQMEVLASQVVVY